MLATVGIQELHLYIEREDLSDHLQHLSHSHRLMTGEHQPPSDVLLGFRDVRGGAGRVKDVDVFTKLIPCPRRTRAGGP